jgi:hypothetical protein
MSEQVVEMMAAVPAVVGLVARVAATEAGAGLAGRLAAQAGAQHITKKLLGDSENNTEEAEETKEKNSEKSKNLKEEKNKYIHMGEKYLIANFLKNLNEKNYAEAHKYLKKIMESKLTTRVAAHKKVSLF